MKLLGIFLFSSLRATVVWLSLNYVHRAVATISGCVGGEAADVVFLLDSSYSVWRSDFRRQLTFVQEVIEMLPIGPNNTRVAIVTYADYPQLQFHLDRYSAKPDLRAAVEEIRQRGGFKTISGDAIRFVRRNVFEVGLRSRPVGVNVARVAVVITDGRSDNRKATVIEADLAKQEGVKMLLVGVGKHVDLEELKDIGSLPSEEYTFLIDNFAGLAGIRDSVVTKACRVAESVKNTKVFATSSTGGRLVNTRDVSTETSSSKDISAETDNNSKSFVKAIFNAAGFQMTASTKNTSVETTLRELLSTGVDTISTTTTTSTFLPSRTTYSRSPFIRPTVVGATFSRNASTRAAYSRRASSKADSSRTASTTAVSETGVTSPVSPPTTYSITSASTRKFYSETVENATLPLSTGISDSDGFWKAEDLEQTSKVLPITIVTSNGGVQTGNKETATSRQPHAVFPTRASEVTVELTANASDFPPSKGSIDSPHETTSGLETSCGIGLLGKILNKNVSSEKPKKDGETEDEIDRGEEQERSTTVRNSDGENPSNHGSSITTSTPVTLVQVTDYVSDVGTKTMLVATRKKSARRVYATVGTAKPTSGLIDGLSEGKTVIANERRRKPSYRTPRLEPRLRRPLVERPEAIQSSTLHDHRDQVNGQLTQESIDEGAEENHSKALHRGNPTSRTSRIPRTNDRRGGYPWVADAIGRQTHRERPCKGYWRLDDNGKLKWVPSNSSQQCQATGSTKSKLPRVQRKKPSTNPSFSPTPGHLDVDGASHLASNSGEHPRLTTDNPKTQRTSVVSKITDATQSSYKQMTRPTRSSKPSGGEIESHNPKEGISKHSTTYAQATTGAGVDPISGTKGPSLFGTDGLSYGYWKREKGKYVWYEYQSPGTYRKAIDVDRLGVPNRIRIEVPPGRVLGCTGCNRTGSPVWYSNSSANSPNQDVSTLVERTENEMALVRRYNRTSSIPSHLNSHKMPHQSPLLIPAVRGANHTGNSKSNWTSDDGFESRPIGGYKERLHSQRANITSGVEQLVLAKNRRTSSTSTTGNPRRGGAMRSARPTSSVSNRSPTWRHLGSHIGQDSVPTKQNSSGKKPSAARNRKKPTKGCVAQRPLDLVFVVDPKSRETPYSTHLWQLVFDVVSQVRMDDKRSNVRFYPDFEVVKAYTATYGSPEHGSVQTVIKKAAPKPVPELLRGTSLLLTKSEKGVRRVIIYLTDGRSGTPRELKQAVEEVRGEAIEMFAVGVGQETDPAELDTIADSSYDGNHLHRLIEPLKSEMDAVALELTRALCGGGR